MAGWRERKEIKAFNRGKESLLRLDEADIEGHYRVQLWTREMGDAITIASKAAKRFEQTYGSYGEATAAFQTIAGDIITEDYTFREIPGTGNVVAHFDDLAS